MTKNKSNRKKLSNVKAGLEETLWQAAHKLRGHIDTTDYKQIVLGLIFIKYISDTFDKYHRELETVEYADPEDRDEYIAENTLYIPKQARWGFFQDNAKSPDIGLLIDKGMDAIEKENEALEGVLPKVYSKLSGGDCLLGELIDLISNIGLGGDDNQPTDILGRVYEYILGDNAGSVKDGQFYTPRCVVELLVKMIEPYKGRVYDPCCGSGGMFVQANNFLTSHGGKLGDISVYGQELNPTSGKLCIMNLAIQGMSGRKIATGADTLRHDTHKILKADYILANPPFNVSDWGGEHLREDSRWVYGTPPVGNANFAWIQHIISHLTPRGTAGVVLANGSMSSNQHGEGQIRRALVDDGIVDCIVSLPGQLFYNTRIPACLWFLSKGKYYRGHVRQRQGEVLFIDGRKLGVLVDRVHRDLTDGEITRISDAYHAWQSPKGNYQDIPGFCKSAKLEEIKGHGYVLTPGRYVGVEKVSDDDEPFEEKMGRLTQVLQEQIAQSKTLEAEIKQNLGQFM